MMATGTSKDDQEQQRPGMSNEDETIIVEALEDNDLDSAFWLGIFREKLGIHKLSQFKFVVSDEHIINELLENKRYAWETNAVHSFLERIEELVPSKRKVKPLLSVVQPVSDSSEVNEHSIKGFFLGSLVANLEAKESFIDSSHLEVKCNVTPNFIENLFSLHSKSELSFYDNMKCVFGFEIASSMPSHVTDCEGRNISLKTQSRDSKHVEAYIRYCLARCKTINVVEKQIKISKLATERLHDLEKALLDKQVESSDLVRQFLHTFGSHVACEDSILGGAFEWVVFYDGAHDTDDSKNSKHIIKEIFQAISKLESNLCGSQSGIWFGAAELFSRCEIKNISSSNLDPYKIRVTKIGGIKNESSFNEWKTEISKTNSVLQQVSLKLNPQTVPIWKIIEREWLKFQDASSLSEAMVKAWEGEVVSEGSADSTSLIGATSNVTKDEIAKDMEQVHSTLHPSITEVKITKKEMIDKLQLQEYHPGKITLQMVMKIRQKPQTNTTFKDLPWVILEKLIMLDHRCRDEEIGNCTTIEEDITDEWKTPAVTQESSMDPENMCPLDVMLVIFESCDPMLQQVLVRKMFLCRLAIPFIVPQEQEKLLCYLWPIQTSVIEWRTNEKAYEAAFLDQPMHIVSFMRVHDPLISKSKLINEIISGNSHNTFFNYECSNGNVGKHITNGLVELSHYLPAGKVSDIFSQPIAFLNLRGHLWNNANQASIIGRLSTVAVFVVDINQTDENEIKMIVENCQTSQTDGIILLVSSSSGSPESQTKVDEIMPGITQSTGNIQVKLITGFNYKRRKPKSMTEIKKELQITIASLLTTKTELQSIRDLVTDKKVRNLIIDTEINKEYREGEKKANDIVALLTGMKAADCKAKMLPLQGTHWKEWSKLLKQLHRSKGAQKHDESMKLKERDKEKMMKLRKEQVKACEKLSPLMDKIISCTEQKHCSDKTVMYLMKCIQLYLDYASRKILPQLQRKHKEIWDKYNTLKHKPEKKEEAAKLLLQFKASEQMISDSGLGLEHIMREFSQIYECVHEINMECSQHLLQRFSHLPIIVAKLLLNGQPLEIMDGDTATVPLTWVKAVLESLEEIIGNKQVFVLSVIGIQSSGKSTLLNTMFGLEFAVSAGRCTRGIYAQLLEVNHTQSSLPFDYLMVLDSEGLRAPELADQKFEHDNELATFIIGLADLTLINLKGENAAEMRDVLQIAVHAFLRMKLADENKKLLGSPHTARM